ncbi:hypothetical protein B0A49_10887 [Cryomyces minteri]|uniref:MACPF domain-containing protein n=1 Tax=Cryomyces minteri TaxID=331657 RepID=A0A4U0WI00_9PEZI|nr:hypothetical protein B0A49_10887 [Cryomyces minteri]
MSLTAPYSNAMRLGESGDHLKCQGFNSYTHEIRINNAVLIGKNVLATKVPDESEEAKHSSESAQTAKVPVKGPDDALKASPKQKNLDATEPGELAVDVSNAAPAEQKNPDRNEPKESKGKSVTGPDGAPMAPAEQKNAKTKEPTQPAAKDIEGKILEGVAPALALAKVLATGMAADSAVVNDADNTAPALDPIPIQNMPTFNNDSVARQGNGVLFDASVPSTALPTWISQQPSRKSGQSVTFSTRSIDNVSDVMDALNISASTSIKYGTIHGNASAAFVNENKVLDSQLNYVVSVKVNNEVNKTDEQLMSFNPIKDMLPQDFTKIYGDCFISGFLEGGEFNAVISIKVNDSSSLKKVKQAADFQLAVGATPVSVGAKESFAKESSKILEGTEITISVNWVGGGEIKKPLRSFQEWKCKMSNTGDTTWQDFMTLERVVKSDGTVAVTKLHDWEKKLIKNYTPCALYTADLFDALVAYKALRKKIGDMLLDPTQYKEKTPAKPKVAPVHCPEICDSPTTHKNDAARPDSDQSSSTAQASPQQVPDGSVAAHDHAQGRRPSRLRTPHHRESDREATGHSPPRRSDTAATYGIAPSLSISEHWNLDGLNSEEQPPLTLNPSDLNEAKLVCRLAMTLITEEAASIVDHPEYAYAEYNSETGCTRMKKPNYAYPEVLERRLPILVGNSSSDTSASRDPIAELMAKETRLIEPHDLFWKATGDDLHQDRKNEPFVLLNFDPGKTIDRMSFHAHRQHWYAASRFSKASAGAIAAIGLRYNTDHRAANSNKGDACSTHCGRPSKNSDDFHVSDLDLTPASLASTEPINSLAPTAPRAAAAASTTSAITRLDICHDPGSGRIAGLILYTSLANTAGLETESVAWRQWGGAAARPPASVKVTSQEPPCDGGTWRFVGFCGSFDTSAFKTCRVLSRVSGVWRRV